MSQQSFTGFRITLYKGRRHEVHLVAANPFYIGRDYDSDLLVFDKSVSRRHLKVEMEGDQILISDCGSANGTRVADEVLAREGAYHYSVGDRIQLGTGHCYVFIEPYTPGLTELDSLAAYPNFFENLPSPILVPMRGLYNIFGSQGMMLKTARAKAERMIINAASIKQSLAKEALQASESRAKLAAEEAEKALEKAQAEAEILIAEGQRLAAEFKSHAEEQAERELGAAQRRAESLEATAKEQSERLINEAKLRVQQSNLLFEKQNILIEETERKVLALRQKSDSEIAAINAKKVDCEQAYRTAVREKDEAQKELGELDPVLTKLRREISDLRVELGSSSDKLQTQETRVSELERTYREKSDEVNGFQIKIKELSGELHILKEKRKNLMKEAEQAEAKSDAAGLERDLCLSQLAIEQGKLKRTSDELSLLLNRQEEARADAKVTLDTAKAQSHEILVKAEADAKRAVERAQANADRLTVKAQRQATQIVKQEQKTQRDLLKKSYLQQQDLYDRAKLECEKHRKERMAEVQVLFDQKMAEAEVAFEARATEAEAMFQEKVAAAEEHYLSKKKEASDLFQMAKEQSAESLKRAKLEAQELVRSAELDSRELRSRSEKQVNQEINVARSQWEVEYKELQSRLEKESQDRSESLANELLARRVSAERELESELSVKKEDLEKEKKRHLHRLGQELQILLGSRLKGYLDQEKIEHQGVDLEKELEGAIRSALFSGELSEDERKKVYGEDPSERQDKIRVFWKRAGMATAAVVTLAIAFPFLKPHLEQKAVEIVQENKTDADSYVSVMTEAWKNKPKFEPERTDEYRATYTDRVVYMTQYPQRELDGGYREKWIVDLNAYVIEELRLSENAIIPFISKEVNLVRELSQKADKINPEFVEDGVARLRELEETFTTEVKELLKTEKNFEMVQKFKKEHFTEYFNDPERRLAGDEAPEEDVDL